MRYTGNLGKTLRNEDGIALVTALMLGLFGMLLVAALLFMVNAGTWMSGSQKRYHMALAAAHGSNNFFVKEVIQRAIGGDDLSVMGTYDGLLEPVASNSDFYTKLTTTGQIGDGTTYPNDQVDATITFKSGNGPDITVNAAVISTSKGNSGTSSNLLLGGGVVNNSTGTMTPQHFPYLYQVRIEGQNVTNPIERAKLSSLYVY